MIIFIDISPSRTFSSYSPLWYYWFFLISGINECMFSLDFPFLVLSTSIFMVIRRFGIESAMLSVWRYIMNDISQFVIVYRDSHNKMWFVSSLSCKQKGHFPIGLYFHRVTFILCHSILLSICIYICCYIRYSPVCVIQCDQYSCDPTISSSC